ncbi:hypothetical protein Cfor_08147 [Coptotermes formosanus]|uniref:BTB domain-containing protein n=1 Tax=Coptotermes formosanus TaxID=36987 RepID=A0A6L2PPE8_COPFO|nr:hypothetical protein Cfor_08147 [Coptotermes formosanus]
MGSATQQYCLRWNNHRTNLLAVFDELLRNEAFTDVTLACEGGTSVKCHKMVLAACSSYFQSLFTELPCRHPVVVLKDVKYTEMKAILEYMYRGEVNVAQDQLAALLKVAEALKVKVPAPSHPHAAAAAMLNSCYEAAGAADMSPLKRKKLQGLLMSRDTPILRTVLGQGQQGQQGSQGQADSSQPMSLVCQPDSHIERNHSNGSAHDMDKNLKTEPSLDEARSPFTDISIMDEETSEKNNKIVLSQSFPGDVRGVSSGIATYVPTQKPEWKRYKQYTRNDIMSAIEAVRSGMSALQASRKYGVPSRTLYDKVKKMGITTSRPFNKRGSNVSTGGGSFFGYSSSGGNGGIGSNSLGGVFGVGGGGMSEGEEPMVNPSPSGTIVEPIFLQHALDGMKRELGDREAMAAMAAAAAAHAASSARSGNSSSSPGENGNGHSPSPSPSLIKYIRSHNSLTPSPAAGSNELLLPSSGNDAADDDEDQVEDLSVARKPEPMRVIMPPMNAAVASTAKREDMHEEDIRDHCASDESRNTSMETAERD